MRRVRVDDDVGRLVRAAEQMARLAHDIAERGKRENAQPLTAEQAADGDLKPQVPPERLMQASKIAMAAHLQLPDFGAPAIFRTPEWLLMLELFAANRSGSDVSVKAASLTLGGAPSTANRAILELEQLGLIASSSDEKDARRRLLKLTPHAESILHDYLSRQSEHRPPAMRVSLKVSRFETDDEVQVPGADTSSIMDRSNSGTESILQS